MWEKMNGEKMWEDVGAMGGNRRENPSQKQPKAGWARGPEVVSYGGRGI